MTVASGPPPPLQLRGGGLTLRRPGAPDPGVTARIPDPHEEGDPAGPDEVGFSVVEDASARAVGRVARRGRGRQARLEVDIDPPARGRGYGAEALRVLSEWSLGLGVERLTFGCAVTDPASARTALSAGYAFEGVSRASGTHAGRDTARFARLAEDTGEPRPPAFPRMVPDGVTDGVLRIRPTDARDLEGWLEQERDPLSIAWGFTGSAPGPGAEATVRAAGLEWIVGSLARMTIVDEATGRFAGAIQLRAAGPPQVAGIGYTVHPQFRGRGYTTRALRLLVPWAFEVGAIARLELGAKVGNVASQRAAAAAGFAADGLRRGRLRTPAGVFDDEVRYALLNPRLSDPRPPAVG